MISCRWTGAWLECSSLAHLARRGSDDCNKILSFAEIYGDFGVISRIDFKVVDFAVKGPNRVISCFNFSVIRILDYQFVHILH